MKKLLFALMASVILFTSGCKNAQQESGEEPNVFNQALADELARMAEVDQTAAWTQDGKFKDLSPEAWRAYQDSVFTTHAEQAKEIFKTHGFPGVDLVGEKGSYNFWLLIQHTDHDPEFQEKVLVEMKKAVDANNASKRNYAYLVDRVNLNAGRKIVYGTQVTYTSMGQAIPRPLEDSLNVNARRAEVGLEPLEVYLNSMTESHFEMNRENYVKRGITEPKLYSVKE